MDFGFSVGDFIAVGKLAWNVYKSCRDAPESFNNISMEVLSLHAVLKEVEEILAEQELPPSKQHSLAVISQGCERVLNDLQALVVKYESLGSKSKMTWDRVRWGANDIAELRARLTSNTTLLTAFMSTSQVAVERKLNKLIREFQRGNHEGSIITTVTVESLAYNDKQTWRAIRKELENIGISVAAFDSNRGFILEWFQKAIESGAFEEKCQAGDWESIQLGQKEKHSPLLPQAEPEISPAEADIRAASGSRGQASFRRNPSPSSPRHNVRKKPPRVVSLIAWALQYNTSFWKACSVGNLEDADKYLSKGAEIDTKDNGGLTPLMIACRRNDLKTAKWLLSRGANPSACDNRREHLLAKVLIHKWNIAILQLLIDEGADINAQDGQKKTVLFIASEQGKEDVVEMLLVRGANTEIWSAWRDTPLGVAALRGHTTVVQKLLDRGAKKESRNLSKHTPLHAAAFAGHTAIVRKLLDNGANINASTDESSAFFDVLEQGHDKMAMLLIERGVDINQVAPKYIREPSRFGNTALHQAAIGGCVKSFDELLRRGLDADAKNAQGMKASELWALEKQWFLTN